MTDELAKTVARQVATQRGLVESMLDTLRVSTWAEPGVTRAPYGEGEGIAHRLFADQATALGFELSMDAAGNSYAIWPGRDRTLPKLVMGSHLDSIANGGNFDGAAGVVAALAAMAAVKAMGWTPACDVMAMAVRAEESAWFRVSYIGSRAALGILPREALAVQRSDTSATLAELMREVGGDPEAVASGTAALPPGSVSAFIEVHIEQAPTLLEDGFPVGICLAVPGNFRFPKATIIGRYDHVGLPRRFRQDAVVAASDFVTAMDGLWQADETAGRPLAMTFGQFFTDPLEHGLTRVPGTLCFSLDVRAYDASHLEELEARLHDLVAEIETRRGVRFDLGNRTAAPVGRMDPDLTAALSRAAERMGVATTPINSPASHDAAAFAAAGVPTAMLLVRNANGSHNPLESMEIDDLMSAIETIALWLAEACLPLSADG